MLFFKTAPGRMFNLCISNSNSSKWRIFIKDFENQKEYDKGIKIFNKNNNIVTKFIHCFFYVRNAVLTYLAHIEIKLNKRRRTIVCASQLHFIISSFALSWEKYIFNKHFLYIGNPFVLEIGIY